MAKTTRLQLVGDSAEIERATDPVWRLFERWMFMMGKNPRRCALGPARRKVIESMLALFDEDTLELAIDGCAASAWHAGQNDRGTEFNDLGLIFRDEAHVERFAAEGERVRARAAAALVRAADEQPPVEEDPEAARKAKDHIRAVARRMSGRQW